MFKIFKYLNILNRSVVKMNKVIFDTDAGIDDIFALLLLIFGAGSKNVEIVGITCVRGNTEVYNVYNNVQRVLKLINKTIPVYIGENEPIITQPQSYLPTYFGKDGFGDKCSNDSNPTPPDMSAHVFINQMVINNPGQISLVCCGPLTNVALAMKLNSKVAENVKELSIMGGNYSGEGNNLIDDGAEFNFRCDVEAVNIVLSKAKCPMMILPKETCEMTKMPVDWRFETLGSINNPVINLLNLVEKQYFENQSDWITYDPLITAIIMNPNIAEEIDANIKIELFDSKTRGQIFIDNNSNVKVKIITKINTDLFKTILYNAINNIK